MKSVMVQPQPKPHLTILASVSFHMRRTVRENNAAAQNSRNCLNSNKLSNPLNSAFVIDVCQRWKERSNDSEALDFASGRSFRRST